MGSPRRCLDSSVCVEFERGWQGRELAVWMCGTNCPLTLRIFASAVVGKASRLSLPSILFRGLFPGFLLGSQVFVQIAICLSRWRRLDRSPDSVGFFASTVRRAETGRFNSREAAMPSVDPNLSALSSSVLVLNRFYLAVHVVTVFAPRSC